MEGGHDVFSWYFDHVSGQRRGLTHGFSGAFVDAAKVVRGSRAYTTRFVEWLGGHPGLGPHLDLSV